MEVNRRSVIQGVAGAAALTAFGVGEGAANTALAATASSSGMSTASGKYSLEFDSAAWSYDATNDVYYQVGTVYVDFATVWAMAHTQAELDNGDPATNFIDRVESSVAK